MRRAPFLPRNLHSRRQKIQRSKCAASRSCHAFCTVDDKKSTRDARHVPFLHALGIVDDNIFDWKVVCNCAGVGVVIWPWDCVLRKSSFFESLCVLNKLKWVLVTLHGEHSISECECWP